MAQMAQMAQASEKSEVVTVHFARFFLLAGAGLAISLYAISSAPLTLPASHARYLLGLLIVSPAVLCGVWPVVFISHSQGAGASLRKTLPLPPLPCG